jgi:succinate dehydrogenase hydrophobic anchor subunit
MRGTRLWLLSLFSAVVIAVLLGVHMVIMHLEDILGFFGVDAAQPTGWVAMIERAKEGIWVGIYIALLAFVLYHALYGLRRIILEVIPSVKTMRIVTWIIVVFGLICFAGGAYVPLALFTG